MIDKIWDIVIVNEYIYIDDLLVDVTATIKNENINIPEAGTPIKIILEWEE